MRNLGSAAKLRPMKKLLALPLLAALSACNAATTPGRGELFMSRQQVESKDDAICRSYGAQPGTDTYIQCRMNTDTRREARRNALIMAN